MGPRIRQRTSARALRTIAAGCRPAGDSRCTAAPRDAPWTDLDSPRRIALVGGRLAAVLLPAGCRRPRSGSFPPLELRRARGGTVARRRMAGAAAIAWASPLLVARGARLSPDGRACATSPTLPDSGRWPPDCAVAGARRAGGDLAGSSWRRPGNRHAGERRRPLRGAAGPRRRELRRLRRAWWPQSSCFWPVAGARWLGAICLLAPSRAVAAAGSSSGAGRAARGGRALAGSVDRASSLRAPRALAALALAPARKPRRGGSPVAVARRRDGHSAWTAASGGVAAGPARPGVVRCVAARAGYFEPVAALPHRWPMSRAWRRHRATSRLGSARELRATIDELIAARQHDRAAARRDRAVPPPSIR